LLLKKLAKLGFGGSFLAWIGSYLTDREQFVRASASQSRRFSVRSGVPKGSHLKPLLFILFINDVFSCFKSLRILLYANDLKKKCPVAGNSDFANAQAELDVFIPNLRIDSGMQLNLGKCKNFMGFTRFRLLTRHFQYELSDYRLDSICDLGVVLDSKFNSTSHIETLIVKASRMLGYIRRIGKDFRNPYTLKTFYNSFVRTHLDYDSGVRH
jgi:hypothetical protein